MAGAVVLVCLVLLAGAFGWASAVKLARPRLWARALDGYALPGPLRGAAAVGVPLVEAAVAVLLISGPARAGAALATALLSAFCLAILRARAVSGERVPCGCFGRSRERDWRMLLGRNALLAALAGVVLAAGADGSVADVASGVGPAEVAALALGLLGVALGAWVLQEAAASLRRRA